ncbi:uncharacterized protein KGF55_000068 [Candida pseudojiufengensis]|uniref:uncharacterized protein n=1 Tax=Candida pseudojiufengensis TaxID=497109 RepID=UPI0022243CDF|nr:uncharacterized protein KGF55_000068 [Candida pseudojiufengensis]KAI5967836.1 hypothetical protein KGF55_000068 [Candida pseudojiufengensis]
MKYSIIALTATVLTFVTAAPFKFRRDTNDSAITTDASTPLPVPSTPLETGAPLATEGSNDESGPTETASPTETTNDSETTTTSSVSLLNGIDCINDIDSLYPYSYFLCDKYYTPWTDSPETTSFDWTNDYAGAILDGPSGSIHTTINLRKDYLPWYPIWVTRIGANTMKPTVIHFGRVTKKDEEHIPEYIEAVPTPLV